VHPAHTHTWLLFVAFFPLVNACVSSGKHACVEDGNLFFTQLETCRYMYRTQFFHLLMFYLCIGGYETSVLFEATTN
jgi:hypothetical protein